MDGKLILESAKICDNNCLKCEYGEIGCYVNFDRRESILAVRDYVKQQVLSEIKEWINDEENIYGDAMGNPVLCKHEMLEKLDSMEPDKEGNSESYIQNVRQDNV